MQGDPGLEGSRGLPGRNGEDVSKISGKRWTLLPYQGWHRPLGGSKKGMRECSASKLDDYNTIQYLY